MTKSAEEEGRERVHEKDQMRKKVHVRNSDHEGMGRGGHKKGKHKCGIKYVNM